MSDQSNQLLDPNAPLGEQIAQNPVGAQLLWGIDPLTLQPKQQAQAINYNYTDPGEAALHLPYANVAMGFGDSPATFVGPGAATADLAALQAAKALEASGTHPGATLAQTGWFRGADGQWRSEISDKDAYLGGPGFSPRKGLTTDANGNLTAVDAGIIKPINPANFPSGAVKLPDVLNHQELFQAYPQLADVNVRPMPEHLQQHYHGMYMPDTNTLYLTGNETPQMLSTLLHETQHKIQEYEGFSKGSNPDAVGGTENYRRIAGEVEARNTQTRQAMSPESRKMVPAWKTQDIPTDQQFMLQDAQGNQHTLTPVQGNPITGQSQASFNPKDLLQGVPQAPIKTFDEAYQGFNSRSPSGGDFWESPEWESFKTYRDQKSQNIIPIEMQQHYVDTMSHELTQPDTTDARAATLQRRLLRAQNKLSDLQKTAKNNGFDPSEAKRTFIPPTANDLGLK